MLDLRVRNFRRISSVELVDDGKVSVVVGYNESGKSSLGGAIEFAFTGSAFGRKGKDVADLVKWGQSRMKVGLKCGRIDIARTPTSGPAIKDVASDFGLEASALPLLFNPKFGAQGGGKAMSAFLALRENAPLDVRGICGEALSGGLLEVIAAARSDAPKDIIFSAETLRAKTQLPRKPVEPAFPRPSADEVTAIECRRPALEEICRLEALVERARSLRAYFARVAEYESQAKEHKTDFLGLSRAAVRECASLDGVVMERIAGTLASGGFEKEAGIVRDAMETVKKTAEVARETLAKNPAAKELGKLPVLSKETADFRNSLSEPTATAALAFQSATEAQIAEQRNALPENAKTKAVLSESLLEIQRRQNIWDAYTADSLAFDVNCQDTQKRWDLFDAVAHTLKDAVAARRQKAAGAFLESVTCYAAPILGERELTLSDDNEICLGGLASDLLSESTKWRLLAAVMAAIAKTAGSPLLVLDGVDILDAPNKTAVMKFVMQQLSPDFEHILLLSTLKGEEQDERPVAIPNITKWLIKDGQTLRLG